MFQSSGAGVWVHCPNSSRTEKILLCTGLFFVAARAANAGIKFMMAMVSNKVTVCKAFLLAFLPFCSLLYLLDRLLNAADDDFSPKR